MHPAHKLKALPPSVSTNNRLGSLGSRQFSFGGSRNPCLRKWKLIFLERDHPSTGLQLRLDSLGHENATGIRFSIFPRRPSTQADRESPGSRFDYSIPSFHTGALFVFAKRCRQCHLLAFLRWHWMVDNIPRPAS